ncbi:MAG TPA: glycosyltransferase family 9 protein [Phycisphaerae bacterium]|nr:glycosyltransferase family 9 protein [Phycisphaerae bacterium]
MPITPAKFLTKARNGAALLHDWARYGTPQLIIHFPAGIGDALLCSTVLRELAERGRHGIWLATSYPELFRNNPDAQAVLPYHPRLHKFSKLLRAPIVMPYYHATDRDSSCLISPPRHIISIMCQHVGICGTITKQPYIYLEPTEATRGHIAERQIAIQSSGASAKFHFSTKEWGAARFQQIVNRMKHRFTFIQIGARDDPLLVGAVDMRGKTTIRESAAIIAASVTFVGLVGMLMHLARAVNRRAVIIYGGRELPSQSGYSCNINLQNNPPCSPCWRANDCPHANTCMESISVDAVVDAINRMEILSQVPPDPEIELVPEQQGDDQYLKALAVLLSKLGLDFHPSN